MERLILDTSFLIAAERGARLDEVVGDEDDVSIAAVTAAELLTGVELATKRHRARRLAFVEQLLSTVPVEPYGLEVARVHARLLAWARRAGRPRGAHDLIIAATALFLDRTVVTADASGFADIPDLALRVS